MKGTGFAACALAVGLALCSPGCRWFRRTPKTPPPPPPATRPLPPPVQPAPKPAPKPKPEPPPEPPPSPPPVLGQILNPQQKAQLQGAYEQSARAARELLERISGRALTPEQSEAAGRVRSFLSQAAQAKEKDPSTAAQLARRAELLARDLAGSLR